jgi:hypothetical protein
MSEPISGSVAGTIMWRQTLELEQAMITGLLEDAERHRQLAGEWAATLPDLPD